MRVPNPRATTTTEAYLAYKAGYLVEEELKPVLYDPIYHYDAWLAYWCGLVNSYPTKANGEPEILTDEEALVAFLSGVTDTYPEEIKDPYNVRVVGYLKYLVSIRFGRPEYPTTNEEFYLSMIKPAVVTNSTPSSNIRLDNTVQGAFLSASIYGDTYQKSYSGWQLLQKDGLATPFSDTTFWDTPGNITQTSLEDGWCRFTSQDSTSKNIFMKRAGAFNWATDTVYTIILEVKNSTSGGKIVLSQPGNASDPFETLSISGQAEYSFTGSDGVYVFSGTTKSALTSNALRPFFSSTFSEGKSVDLRMTIVAGDHTSDYQNYIYEPYVGGIPAPNPDYPQNVNAVTGEQTITVAGKNLYQSIPRTHNGLTGVLQEDGTVKITGTATNIACDITSNMTTNLPAGTYTFSLTKAMPFRVLLRDDELSSAQNIGVIEAGNTKATFTVSEVVTKLRVFFYNVVSGTAYDETVGFMLEAGSSATDFEPYVAPQNYAINLGSIELCKIGTYQDYIYKGDDGWYVHKAIEKTDMSAITQDWGNLNADGDIYNTWFVGSFGAAIAPVISNIFSYSSTVWDGVGKFGISNLGNLWLQTGDPTVNSSTITTWFTNKSAVIYYALATPTDTLITDNTLVGQLESLLQGGSYKGTTCITVTATGDNLPGLLQVEAGEYR